MDSRITRRRFTAIATAAAAQLTAAAPETIQVGCQLNAFPLHEGDFHDVLSALEQIRKLGYAGFECNIRHVRGQFNRIEAARKEIEQTGVRFIGAHTSMADSTNSSFPDAMSRVAALGAQTVVMSGRGLSDNGIFSADAVREKASAMEKLAAVCRERGIRFSYHNHNPEFANQHAEMEALVRATSAELVSFLMDAGHAHLGGGDPAKFLSAHSSRVFGIHLKTFKGKEMTGQQPLGRGDFDFEDLAAAVRKTGWKGWIIDEEGGGPIPGNYGALGPDREHIRRLFGV